MISCFAWVRKREVGPTMELAERLWPEKHDLLQKAVGWMLREVGKYVDESLLVDFLDRHAYEMPRTELRYAIERLPEDRRREYLALGR
jgi:3-methyladenine DNA glycosylase AlkD